MIKINEYQIPQSIEEMDWQTYRRIMALKEFDSLSVLSAIIGVPKDVLENESYANFPFLFSFEVVSNFLTTEKIKTLSTFDVSHKVADFDMWKVKAGQVAQAFDLANAKLEHLEAVESLVSIFHFGSINEKANLQSLPAYEVLSLHAFFLGKWKELHKLSQISGASMKPRLKKNRLTRSRLSVLAFGKVLTNWLKAMF